MSTLLLDISLTNERATPGSKSYVMEYQTSSKFHKDKVNFENEDFHIVIDGIVLNKSQLLKESDTSDWAGYLTESYKRNGDHFFKSLKGSYYGVLYDRKEDKWIVFTDHISSKALYHAQYGDHLVFSNTYVALVDYLKEKQSTVSLNVEAAYLLLTYGYVFEDITIAKEISRIKVGYCAIINKELRFEKFYTLKNKPVAISETEAIEKIDILFRKAVTSAFEKDIEYGYKHTATLSGGLDSRMTVWVAHELGYTDQLNLTFSQSDYLDETIAKHIARDLKHEWFFKALDNGNFLKNIEKTTEVSGGNVLYYGLAHGMSLYNYVNFKDLGVIHTGQLGDVMISTFYSSLDPDKKYSLGDGAYSQRFISKIEGFKIKEEYPNEELFKMYIRGFYGANQGLNGIMGFSETYSPFYDIDFMEFALSIPLALRYDHNLYKKWIQVKYPQAARYIWERENVPVDYRYFIPVQGKKVPLNQLPGKIASRLGLLTRGDSTKNHMNPLQYWYETNTGLRAFMDAYYQQHIGLLHSYPGLKEDCKSLYGQGNGTEKVQVLSLLAVMDRFFKS